jgi:hypothetical protein
MDRAGLSRPPLTLTASILVSFKEPAPPNTPLVVRSSVVEVKEGDQPGVSKVGDRGDGGQRGADNARVRDGCPAANRPIGQPGQPPHHCVGSRA